MLAYCLADFFNLALWPAGREPTFPDIRDGLEILVSATVAAVRTADARRDEVLIRLYGGWHEDELGTRVVAREIVAAAAPSIPRTIGARVRIEIADTPLWDRSLRMLRTLRKSSFPALRGTFHSAPTLCSRPAQCAVNDLRRWWQGRCPSKDCSVRLSEIGWTHRQKMVDTLMTADALSALHMRLCDVLAIASDDDDLLPALLACSRGQARTVHLRRNEPASPYYARILERQGVVTHKW